MLTTSHRPTKVMRTFCHDLERTIPNVIRINRGKLSFDGLAEKALEFGANRIIVVDRWQGGVGKIQLFYMKTSGLVGVAPIVYVRSVKLRREIGREKAKPTRLLATQKSSQNSVEVNKLIQSLSEFLDVPILSIEDAISKGFQSLMKISLDASNHIQITFLSLPKLIEIGPCITVKHLVWEMTK